MNDLLQWLKSQQKVHERSGNKTTAENFHRAAEEIKRLRSIVKPLEELRQSPRASIELFLDVDVDFEVDDTTPSAVVISDEWTHWRRVRFEGKSLAEALANALKAREAAKKGQTIR